MDYNFKTMIKKVYKRLNEMIKKRKEQAISVQTQADFSQDDALRDL